MVNKTVGYIAIGVGLVVLLASSFQQVKSALFLTAISNIILTVVGIVVLGIGVFILSKFSRSKKEKDVPIYKGKEVVGYRRIKS